MMNKAKVIGILINTGQSEYGYAGITVLVKRPAQDEAYVKMVLDTVLDPSITIGSTVEVDGYLRGYNAQTEDGKWRIVQYLKATNVKLATSKIEEVFGVKGHFNPDHLFDLFVEGVVTTVIDMPDAKDYKKVGLKIIDGKEKPEVISIDLKKNKRTANEFDTLRKDDVIQTHLNIKTPLREYNGEKRAFVDIFIEDFVITNREVERYSPFIKNRQDFGLPADDESSSRYTHVSDGGRRRKGNVSPENRFIDEVVVEGTVPKDAADNSGFDIADDEAVSTQTGF